MKPWCSTKFNYSTKLVKLRNFIQKDESCQIRHSFCEVFHTTLDFHQPYKVSSTFQYLYRTEDVHLHTPALQIGTHFLLTLETIVSLSSFKRHLKPFLFSFYTRLAHAARLGFFYKNALYKFTVIIIIIIIRPAICQNDQLKSSASDLDVTSCIGDAPQQSATSM